MIFWSRINKNKNDKKNMMNLINEDIGDQIKINIIWNNTKIKLKIVWNPLFLFFMSDLTWTRGLSWGTQFP